MRLLPDDERMVLMTAKAVALPTEVKHLAHYAVVSLPYNGRRSAQAALRVSVSTERSLLFLDPSYLLLEVP